MIIHDVIQGYPEWLIVRKATITWSRAKALKTMPLEPDKIAKIDWKSSKTRVPAYVTLMLEMIWEDLAPLTENFQNDAMARWNELEPDARIEYERLTWDKVEEIGFCTHNTRKYLGLSPDGFIETNFRLEDEKDESTRIPIYWKAIEIKCPGPKNHIKIINSNQIPEEYSAQIVHNFLVNEDLQELDFVSYNPDMYLQELKTHIITVKREDYEQEIKDTFEKLDTFSQVWEEIILELTNK